MEINRRNPWTELLIIWTVAAFLWLYFTPCVKAAGNPIDGIKPIRNYPPSEYVYHYPQNWGFLQDRQGRLYVANQAGLLMYDGKYWQGFDIPNDSVRSMDIDDNDRIFLGGNNEIGCLTVAANGAEHYRSLSSHIDKSYRTFSYVFNTYCTAQGVFFRCKKYLFRWHRGQMKTWIAEEETNGEFDGLFMYGQRILVHSKDAGLLEIKGDILQPVPGGQQFIGDVKITLAVSHGQPHKHLLIGTRTRGFFIYDDDTHRFQRYLTGCDDYLAVNKLYKGIPLIRTPDALALTTMSGGLIILNPDGSIQARYDKSSGLISDVIYAVYEDRSGNLWLATDSGISKIEYTSPITIYDDRLKLEGLALSVISHGNHMFVGTGTGVYRWTPANGFQRQSNIDGMCNSLLSIDDSLLAAAHTGLFVLTGQAPAFRITATGTYALAASQVEPARVWAGTANGLIALNRSAREKTGKDWQIEQHFTGIDGPVKTIVEDAQGNLWLGTGTLRLYRVDFSLPGKIGHYRVQQVSVPDDIPESSIRVSYAAGHVIFATRKGIYRYHSQSRSLMPDNTLGDTFGSGSTPVFLIHQGLNGCIWFYSQGRFYLAAPGKNGSYDVRSLAFPGLTSYQLHDVYTGNDPTIAWLAGDRGLVRYQTANIADAPFPVLLRRIDASGKKKSENAVDNDLQLPYDRRHIQFRFAAPYFVDEAATHYSYFLEGTDKDWSAWTNDGNRDYIGLEPGAYRFRVRARNVYGRESKEAAFEFSVLPPWYRSWWAYALYILVLLLAMFGGFRWRLLKLRRDKQRLEHLIREATLEIREKNDQLHEQAQELKEMAAVRSRFFTNISHEFRTPLTMIMGPLDQLMAGAGEEKMKPLKMMKRNAQRLLTLINQLLALSRIDKGKMKLKACEQNIAAFLKGILGLFELSARSRKIELIFNAQDDRMLLYFDPEKLEDVFCNLLLNVINLTPAKNKIQVGVNTDAASMEPSRHGFLEISVLAEGLDIPGKQMEHMFDRFYLAEEAYEDKPKGYGIGLALAKELITLHKGELAAWRVEEKGVLIGTCFVVRLPLGHEHLEPEEIIRTCNQDDVIFAYNKTAEDAVEPYRPPSTDSGSVSGSHSQPGSEAENNTVIILLVEDNADTREFIIESLEPDYKIIEAENGRDGIKKAREIIPDLIISDIIMPYVDGYKLCRQLKKDVRTSHIPIILLTAKSGEESILRGLETGADDYITKPFNLNILHARIKNLIDLRRQGQLKMERQLVLQPSDVSVSPIDADFIKELQEEIEKNLSDAEFGVEELAKKLYMSRATLYRKIHALTGESPHRFIRSFRLKRAAQLFKANFGNVSEVAMEVGFNNISYFSQCFKEKFHLLPTEYLNAEAEHIEKVEN